MRSGASWHPGRGDHRIGLGQDAGSSCWRAPPGRGTPPRGNTTALTGSLAFGGIDEAAPRELPPAPCGRPHFRHLEPPRRAAGGWPRPSSSATPAPQHPVPWRAGNGAGPPSSSNGEEAIEFSGGGPAARPYSSRCCSATESTSIELGACLMRGSSSRAMVSATGRLKALDQGHGWRRIEQASSREPRSAKPPRPRCRHRNFRQAGSCSAEATRRSLCSSFSGAAHPNNRSTALAVGRRR